MDSYTQKIYEYLKNIAPGSEVNISDEYKKKYPNFIDIAKNYMVKDWTISFNKDDTKIIKLCQQFIDSINAESLAERSRM